MAAVLQGTVSFPGIPQDAIISCTYTLSHGITPGHAVLECKPQTNFAGAGGDLKFTFSNVSIKFTACKIDYLNNVQGPQGWVWRLTILDRRWKWASGTISGRYNTRVVSCTPAKSFIEPASLKTPRQLAELCLQAMQEQNYDASVLDASIFQGSYPEVDWDHDNPARSLADLCDQFGCRVVLTTKDRVMIVKTGTGQQLPSQDVMEDSSTIDPPERPDSIMVVCGPTRFQNDWKLKAVGKDLDGSIKPIDMLSYKPVGGWGINGAIPPDFPAIDAVKQPLQKKYAKQSVFKWYQLDFTSKAPAGQVVNAAAAAPASAGVFVPGFGNVQTIDQVQLEGQQVATYFDVNLKVNKELPALVYGVFLDNTQRGNWPVKPKHFYQETFEIDRENGIVKLATYTGKLTNIGAPNQTFSPADLILRTACTLRDAKTGAWVRYEKSLDNGTKYGTGPRVEKHDEIVLCFVPQDEQGTKGDGKVINMAAAPKKPNVLTNQKDVDTECNYWLQGADLDYQLKKPQERKYMGLKQIDPDGAIQQISWSVGPQGATTRASRNSEFSNRVPPYKDRRDTEILRGNPVDNLQQKIAATLNEDKIRLTMLLAGK